MIKVKDGYAKLIGTTYSGSASRVLLSNGGDHVLGNASGNIPLNNGTVSTNLNADMLDGLHWNSFARWYGDASTDSTAKDVTATSTADFFAKIHATSGLFNSRFGAMRGSWWYVGNTLLNTGVGTLEMAGTAVLNLGSYADTNDTYKSLLFLDQGGRLWSYTANETAVKQWSRYAKTTDIPTVTNYYWANVKVSASSSTGTTPTFSTCYTSNWFRSTGTTGWYSESYGGGIHMLDSTWVRTWNGKSFYCSAIIQAGGRIYTGYDSGLTNSISCSNWFRSNGNTGWYNPTNNCHVYPNASTTYGGLMLRGEKGGYTGFILGTNTNYMNLMDNGTDKGLYQEGKLWILYYNRSSNYVGIRTSSLSDPLTVSGITRVVANSKYLRIGPQNSSHAHYETNADVSHWFNKRVDVNGAIWRYGTIYGIESDGKFYAHTVYANHSGSSTAGGVSLYSSSDPMTYGIAFRGTGTYGTHGGVSGDWATYFTMSDTTNRGWIFRRGSSNVFSISGTGYISSNNSGYFAGNLSSANSGASSPGDAALEVREYARAGTNTSTAPHSLMYAPRIGFHWGNRYWANLIYFDSAFRFMNNSGSSYVNVVASTFYGNLSGTASYASNADTVDGQHFNWNNNKNDHTYLWAASSSGLAYLVHRASMSVNYATYARYVYCTSGSYLNFQWSGQGGLPTWLFGSNDGANVYVWNPSNFNVNSAAVLRGNASNPNNSHPGHGAKVFYSWNTGQANNASSGYSNGITIGSHPNDTGYGFQIVQNMWDDRTYTRRYNGGWLSWKTLAWTSDIPSVGNGTVTIKQAGTTKGSFTMNQSGNTTIELTDNNTTYSFAPKGSATQGIYLAGTNTFAAMTYSLKATVNAGTSSKLAYYSGANAISAYTSTCGDYYKPIYLSGGVPIACYARSIGSVTWGTNCSGYIQVKLFGPIVILQGYFTKINVNQTSSTNYVFKLPTGTPSPATTVGITLSLDDGYENDRNTIIMISGQYGYCNTGYNSFNPNRWTYYFSACYMA